MEAPSLRSFGFLTTPIRWAKRRGREGPAGRSVFAGKHDGLVGDIERERGEREIGEGDALGVNDVAVAVVARQASGTVFGNCQLLMLEGFGGDLGAGALGEGYFVQKPVSASFFGHELRAIGVEDGTGEAVAVKVFAQLFCRRNHKESP